jgi:hypothetical protein
LSDHCLVGFWNLRRSHLTHGSQEPTIRFRTTSAFQVDCWVASPSNLIQSSSSNGIASVKLFQVRSVQLTIIPEIDRHCNACKRGRTSSALEMRENTRALDNYISRIKSTRTRKRKSSSSSFFESSQFHRPQPSRFETPQDIRPFTQIIDSKL